MKIGVLGTGFGVVHLQTFSNHPLVDEVTFFSRTQKKAEKLSAQMGLHGTTNADDILCDSTVDIVTIALPPALHTEMAVRAMEHGKDVICEIPVCPTLAEAEKLTEASRRTGKRVLVNLFTRFGAVNTFLKEKIVSGEYGRLLSLQVVGRNAPVWGEHPMGLSVLPLESCYCDFAWLDWCLGTLSIHGASAIDVPEKNGASIDLVLKSESGVPVQVTTSTLMPLSMGVQSRIEATFERAALVYTETSWCKDGNAAQMTLYDNEQKQTISIPEANVYYDSLTYSLERILDKKPGITDLSESIPALVLALELENSI